MDVLKLSAKMGQTFNSSAGRPRRTTIATMVFACLPASLIPLGCGTSDPSDIAVFGLQAGDCGPSAVALFGKVPIRLAPIGGGDFSRVSLRVGASTTIEDDSAPFQLELDTTQLPDGKAQLVISGVGRGGDTVSKNLDVCVDNNGPQLTLLAPKADASVGIEDSGLRVRVRATDPLGVKQITATLGMPGVTQQRACDPPEGPDATCVLDPGKLSLSFGTAGSATLSLTVTARDQAGRESQVKRELKVKTRLNWRYFAGGPIRWAVANLPSGNVVVGTDAGTVRLVDQSGKEVCGWVAPAFNGRAEGIASAPTINADGSLAIFTTTKHVCAINTTNCKSAWCQSGLYFRSRPAIDNTKAIVYVGRYGENAAKGTLVAYRLATGAPVGSTPITETNNAAVVSSPTISADGNTVYIGSSDFKLYAIDSSDPTKLKQRWTYKTGAKIETRPLVTGGRIYITGFDGQIHALDPAGAKLSSFTFKAQAPFTSEAISSVDGTIYAGNLDEWLYALNSSGKEVNKFKIGRMHFTAPAAGQKGTVFAAQTKPGRLYGLTSKLAQVWSFRPSANDEHEFRATPLVVGNALYIGNTNGFLYSLDASPPEQ